MSLWLAGQEYISQLEKVETEEEGENQIVMRINKSNGKPLCSYNKTVMEAIRIAVHMMISL